MEATLQTGFESSLCAGILMEARRQADGILNHARQEGTTLIAQAEVRAAQLLQERQTAANQEANQRRQRILAALPVEVARARCLALESLLSAIRERALDELEAKQSYNYEASILALASEAIAHMTGNEFQLVLQLSDGATLGRRLTAAVANQVKNPELKLTIAEDPAMTSAGIQLYNVSRNETWDNRLASRLERLWPELRQQLAVQIAARAEP